ncbi:cytochrome c oxidase subunit IV [Piedraia hortae CBS 480.64]|uniref:Cytochrome c oxidase polypeptide V n=1 Tax=Piedraia hortae CBS 480.64 TaxID=1314780 RepID=A0A6A7BP66_9PEZI|nr:cytochrome c oxidase subunit IV [Piedraia hortae CBS 480.64]
MLRTSFARAPSIIRGPVPVVGRRNAHAISNPTLANIEKRWEGMPPQEQAELWMALRDRMKVDWHELTTQEKRAAYWIAFGPHGPRALPPPNEGRKIILYVTGGLLVSGALFSLTRYSMGGASPATMSKEWQEKSNEYMKENKIEPITGVPSDDYKGAGMVQNVFGLKEPKPQTDEEEEA